MTKGVIGYIRDRRTYCYRVYHDAFPQYTGQIFLDLVKNDLENHKFGPEMIEKFHFSKEDIILDLSQLNRSIDLFEYVYLYDMDAKGIIFGMGRYEDEYGNNIPFKKKYRWDRIDLSICSKYGWKALDIFNFEPRKDSY